MAEKKKEVPKHIQEFYNRAKKVNQLLAATEDIHSQAYSKALEVIKDKGTGLPDHDKLEDTAVQDSMIDKMIDHYKSAAVEKLSELKGKDLKAPGKGTIEEDMFLQKYVGITRSQLTRLLRKHKSDYTQKKHEGLRDQLMEKQRETLLPLRHAHLDEKHLDDIVKYVGVGKHVEAGNIHEMAHAGLLLDIYKDKGEITLADLAKFDLPSNYFKKEAKDAMKKLKDKYKQAA
ncbi:MAG: hypothetical protein Q7S55_01045 [Nanoarchaeota archaeon]|nr:hypothetical protein [Nanoarchaeota archaeon]